MPIDGLTERRELTCFGHLRRGRKVQNKSGKGTHAEGEGHFTADFEDKNLERLFHEIYGEQPERVTIGVISDDPLVFFDHHYMFWGGSANLKCKGNGKTASRKAGEKREQVPCPGPDECDFCVNKKGGKDCSAQGFLKFFIKGVPGLQYCIIDTKGVNNIVHFNTAFDYLKKGRPGQGIAGVWVDLLLVPQDGCLLDGTKTNFYVIKVVPPGPPDQWHLLEGLFTPKDSELEALPAPDETPETEAIEAEAVPVMDAQDTTRNELLAGIKKLIEELGTTKQKVAQDAQKKFNTPVEDLNIDQLSEIYEGLGEDLAKNDEEQEEPVNW